jgi:hypothetical protein
MRPKEDTIINIDVLKSDAHHVRSIDDRIRDRLVFRNSREPNHSDNWETEFNRTDGDILYDLEAEFKEVDDALQPWEDTFAWRKAVGTNPFIIDFYARSAVIHQHQDGSTLRVELSVRVEISS